MLTLAIHEAGHIAAMAICGVPVLGIGARTGGLRLYSRADSLPYGKASFVYAGGAIANLLTAALFFRVTVFAAFSVGAAVFNLLPLPGSDGEMILSALLSRQLDSPDLAFRIVRSVSDFFVFAFWCTAVYLGLVGRGSMTMLVFAIGMVIFRLGERAE